MYSAYAPLPRQRRAVDPELEIGRIARQLGQVARAVPWGRVQDNAWDADSRFVYRLRSVASARLAAERVAGDRGAAFVQYALRRWFCFWGARMAELLFLRHPGVRPGPPRHHQIDFTIDGVPFDLKTSEVPRLFQDSVDDLAVNPGKLASWLYQHQSREGRFHNANRLFLLLCDPVSPAEAWRLRADLPALRQAVDGFLARRRFAELELPDRYGVPRTVRTAVIPVVREDGPRQLGFALSGSIARAPRSAERPVLAPRLL